MITTREQTLKSYYTSVDKLTRIFLQTYFSKDADYWWVADDIGGVFHCNDYFFGMETIKKSIEMKLTTEQFDKWLEYDTVEWVELLTVCDGENPTKDDIKELNKKFGIDRDSKLNIEHFIKYAKIV